MLTGGSCEVNLQGVIQDFESFNVTTFMRTPAEMHDLLPNDCDRNPGFVAMPSVLYLGSSSVNRSVAGDLQNVR